MLRLRAAELADAAVIYEMIGELADFERLRAQMSGGLEALRRHLFGEPRCAQVLLAEWDGQVAGFALYFFNYSTFLCRPGLYLEDLFVREAFRRRGIGASLLRRLEQCARECGCGRLEWAVLDWNEAAQRFYRLFGAAPLTGWTLYRKPLAS
jgi:GNAT superfamily N-acetyltransferase